MPEPFTQLPAVEVRYLGRPVGVVASDPRRPVPVFEYFPDWLDRGEELAPLKLRRAGGVHEFPELLRTSFRGLPGLVADSLPGTFADLLTNAWLARHGVQPGEVSVVDRLGYIAGRGVGALTYHPALREDIDGTATVIDLAEVVDTARRALTGTLRPEDAGSTLEHLFDTAGSAGGAHAKAAVALGPDDEVRSGQHDAPDGFSHWLLKFDVDRHRGAGEPTGLGRVEYAYHLMAVDAGLHMTECRLLEVDGLAHFLTRRFDRSGPVTRVHVQSLAAISHLPPEHPGAHSYEQFLQTCRALRLSDDELHQAFRRVVFNIAAAVRDDHTKNIAFTYRDRRWSLSPAFDLTFPFLEGGGWMTHHQMTIAGSARGATRSTLLELAERAKIPGARESVDEVVAAVRRWPSHAAAAEVEGDHARTVASELARTALAG